MLYKIFLLILSFRTPMSIKQVYVYLNNDCYPICPRCNSSLDREYMSYCNNCGQKLSWKYFNYKNNKIAKIYLKIKS